MGLVVTTHVLCLCICSVAQGSGAVTPAKPTQPASPPKGRSLFPGFNPGWLNLVCACELSLSCAPVVHRVFNSSPVSRTRARKARKGRGNAGAPARGRPARGRCCGPGPAHEQRGVARGRGEADEPVAQRHHSWCGVPGPAKQELARHLQRKSGVAPRTAWQTAGVLSGPAKCSALRAIGHAVCKIPNNASDADCQHAGLSTDQRLAR